MMIWSSLENGDHIDTEIQALGQAAGLYYDLVHTHPMTPLKNCSVILMAGFHLLHGGTGFPVIFYGSGYPLRSS